jgi:hypothetical protein
VATKDLNAQLILKLNNRLGNPRLGCEEGFCGGGQVELLANGFADKPKLMQIHEKASLYILIDIGTQF